MKITPKGIGWLIFGVIVCASATEAIGIVSALSTIALGLVFILIYVMKQFFKPRGIGWYIFGGMLLAFCIESGANSDSLIAAVLGFASLVWFYYRNKEALDYMFSGMTTDEIGDFSYVDEDTYPEPETYETVEEVVEEAEGESEETEPALQTYPPEGPEGPIVEFEVTEDEKSE